MLLVMEKPTHPRIQRLTDLGFDVSVWKDFEQFGSMHLRLTKGQAFWHYLFTAYEWGEFLHDHEVEPLLLEVSTPPMWKYDMPIKTPKVVPPVPMPGVQLLVPAGAGIKPGDLMEITGGHSPGTYKIEDVKGPNVTARKVQSLNELKTQKTLWEKHEMGMGTPMPVGADQIQKHVQQVMKKAMEQYIGQPISPLQLDAIKDEMKKAIAPYGHGIAFDPIAPPHKAQKTPLAPPKMLIGFDPIVKGLEDHLQKQLDKVPLSEMLGEFPPAPPGNWSEFELHKTATDKTYVPPKPPVFHHPKVSFMGELESVLKKHGIRTDRTDVRIALELLKDTCESSKAEEKALPPGRFVDLSDT